MKKTNTGSSVYYDEYDSYDYPKNFLSMKSPKEKNNNNK